MYSKIFSGAALGIEGLLITVESDIGAGLPGFSLVGYLSSSVKEAGDRVRTALKNIGFTVPSRRITINLSPADVRKDGASFDLAIAVGLLISMGIFSVSDEFQNELSQTLFLGELGLDGSVLPVSAVLPIVDHASKQGIKTFVLPRSNCREAAFVDDIKIIPVDSLVDIVEAVEEEQWSEQYIRNDVDTGLDIQGSVDMKDIRGQEVMKRGVMVAVAGFHNVLMTGAAGSGKSMVAKCIPDIMPPLSYEERMELTKIYSVAGMLVGGEGLLERRPFRSPHSSVSSVALLGGGAIPKPGEISLASSGVLFLDEFPEFKKETIEALRQPLEDKTVTISRSRASYTFPAKFMLVSARNNCPCGYYPDRKKCRCTFGEIYHYQNKISHPIMDRIDIRIDVSPVKYEELFGSETGMSTEQARDIIIGARERQNYRYRNERFKFNCEVPQGKLKEYMKVGAKEEKLLREIYEKTEMSTRGYFRLIRLARTIADINDKEDISCQDIEEALFYRNE